jgi:ketosteroid isomerase-like protein
MSHEQILDLGRRWADAERRADMVALEALLADDFVGIGPRGFVLSRQQWLERYRSGDLKIDAFWWDDVAVREYGDAAIAVGIQTQRASHRGTDASGRFRVSQVAVRQAGRWLLAGLQLSGPIVDAPPRQG